MELKRRVSYEEEYIYQVSYLVGRILFHWCSVVVNVCGKYISISFYVAECIERYMKYVLIASSRVLLLLLTLLLALLSISLGLPIFFRPLPFSVPHFFQRVITRVERRFSDYLLKH